MAQGKASKPKKDKAKAGGSSAKPAEKTAKGDPGKGATAKAKAVAEKTPSGKDSASDKEAKGKKAEAGTVKPKEAEKKPAGTAGKEKSKPVEAPAPAAKEKKASPKETPEKKPAEAAGPKEKEKAKPATEPPKAVEVPAEAPPGPPIVKKKKNVKRGAPPMLPRRGIRRPDPNAAPPPPRPASLPGSLHTPARAPEGADVLKQRLSTVMTLLSQLKALKRTFNRQFFEAGVLLKRLNDPELYKARGYGSFDAFVEREIERELNIGRGIVRDLVLIVKVFQREPAEELGLEKLRAAVKVLFPETQAPGTPGGNGSE